MKRIRLEHIVKLYNSDIILDDLTLEIPEGQFFALLGPSGCGKTTLLRLIAGFEKVTSGTIYLGNQNITHVPINKRPINTVFQNYALFPHLNVFDNVAYSLSIRNVAKDEIERKVIKILKTVHLDRHIYKSIQQLSGGQKQRVALARAIINGPEVLLLDEPLAALDLKLRERMLLELIDLQETLKTTFIYVTHDQMEALTVADKMAIMNHDGEIEQIGTPKEIYEFPKSTFVARFVGTTNIFSGILKKAEEGFVFDVQDLGKFLISIEEPKDWMQEGTKAYLSLRPEKIWLSIKETSGLANHLEGVVESIVYQGRATKYNIRLNDEMLIHVFEQNEEHFPKEVIDYGMHVHLYWQKENAVLLER